MLRTYTFFIMCVSPWLRLLWQNWGGKKLIFPCIQEKRFALTRCWCSVKRIAMWFEKQTRTPRRETRENRVPSWKVRVSKKLKRNTELMLLQRNYYQLGIRTFQFFETRFSQLETRFSELETRIFQLETRCSQLETRIFEFLKTRFSQLKTRTFRLETWYSTKKTLQRTVLLFESYR